MYDFLLFVHVLAAFSLASTVVLYLAWSAGAAASTGAISAAGLLWDIGGLGTLVFGVWLALDSYAITDGWILAAIALWLAVAAVGGSARRFAVNLDDRPDFVARFPWVHTLLRTALVLALLWVMIDKPGA